MPSFTLSRSRYCGRDHNDGFPNQYFYLILKSSEDSFLTFINQAPITSIHISLGWGNYILSSLCGIGTCSYGNFSCCGTFPVPFRLTPSVGSFFYFGTRFLDHMQLSICLLTYGSKLEQLLNGSGDIVRDKTVVEYGRQRQVTNTLTWNKARRKTLYEWLLRDNRFFWHNIVTGASILGMFFMHEQWMMDVSRIQEGGQECSLVYALAFAHMWLYSWMEEQKEVELFGMFPLPTLLLPIATFVIASKGGLFPFFSGLVASLISCVVLQHKRRRGESVVSYLWQRVQWFFKEATTEHGDDPSCTLHTLVISDQY